MSIEYKIQFNANQKKLLEQAVSHDLPVINFFEASKFWQEAGMGCADLEDLDWSISKAKKVMRSLYGIFMINELRSSASSRYSKHLGYAIQNELVFSVMEALDNKCLFEGQVDTNDLNVLQAIYNRESYLKSEYNFNGSTRFTYKEVARLANKSQQKTKESLMRLPGLLGKTHTQLSKRGSTIFDSRTVTMRTWFVPRARISQIEEVLG